MSMTLDDIKSLVTWMRSEQVASFQVAELKVTFVPNAHRASSGSDRAEVAAAPTDPIKAIEEQKRQDEEILYYSAG